MFGEARLKPRVVLFGLPGIVSSVVLDAFLHAGLRPVATVVPASASPHLAPTAGVVRAAPLNALALSPLTGEGDFVGRAWDADVPVLVTRQAEGPEFVEALEGLAPDLVLVACFTQRLPAAVLRVPRWGCLNLHPSLLPAYRGPAPLFWQLRDGMTDIGVTVHWMDERLDTGDIAAQRPLTLPEGASGPEADRLWASAGAAMALAVLADLERGHRARYPQAPGGSYQGHPVAADFALSADWPARRAFVFMRGTEEWGRPFLLLVGGQTYALRGAVDYSPEDELPEAVVRDGRFLRVQFTPGVLRAHI